MQQARREEGPRLAVHRRRHGCCAGVEATDARDRKSTHRDQEQRMSQKVAYVTGGMGGIGTAICQRLHQDGFTVIAGCGPSRDYAKWLGEQTALGYTFHASVGNVADWDSTVDAFTKVQGRARPDRRAGQQRRHHARPLFRKMTPRRLGRGDRDQPEQHVQRHQAGDRRHGRAAAGAASSTSPRSTARRASSARPTTRPPRPACTASRWRWRRKWRARA